MPGNSNTVIELIKSIPDGVNDFGKNFFPALSDIARGRLKWFIYFFLLVIFLFCGALSFFTYERITNNIYLDAIDQKVIILNKLAESGVLAESELKPLYESIANDLSKSEVVMINAETVSYYFSIVINSFSLLGVKFMSGAALGVLFLIIALLSSREGKKEAVIGSFRLLISFGFIGILLSSFISNFLSFGLLTIAQLVFLIRLGRKSRADMVSNNGVS